MKRKKISLPKPDPCIAATKTLRRLARSPFNLTLPVKKGGKAKDMPRVDEVRRILQLATVLKIQGDLWRIEGQDSVGTIHHAVVVVDDVEPSVEVIEVKIPRRKTSKKTSASGFL